MASPQAMNRCDLLSKIKSEVHTLESLVVAANEHLFDDFIEARAAIVEPMTNLHFLMHRLSLTLNLTAEHRRNYSDAKAIHKRAATAVPLIYVARCSILDTDEQQESCQQRKRLQLVANE